MKEQYIELLFEIENKEQGEILIACLHEALEIEGFEENENVIKAYIATDKFNTTFFERYPIPANITYTQTLMENKNWNAIWESEFKPVIINNFVGIRADFHNIIKDVTYEIIITPKMSFGTGHHATTSLMLETLQHQQISAKRVVDFGTGTGVLAILAEKMKAAEVLAIDYDHWSMDNATENIAKNKCTNVQLLQTDHFPIGEKWDLILANINLNVILENMPLFYQGLNANGLLIVSGILQDDLNKVLSTATNHLFSTKLINEKNNWLCITFQKSEPANTLI